MRIEEMMTNGEQILWQGGKAPEATFWESVFNPLLPVAVFWCLFDVGFLGSMLGSGAFFSPALPFFLVHMMPVWIYLGGILTAKRSAQNTRYCVTTNGVYIQTGGAGSEKVKYVPFDEIRLARANQGRFDRKYHVGDVICDYVTPIVRYVKGKRRVTENFTIDNIADYQQVFQLINQQKAQIGPPLPSAVQGNALTARQIPPQLSQPAYPAQQPAYLAQQGYADPYAGTSMSRSAASDPYAGTSAETGEPEITDPQAAFFGGMQPEPAVPGSGERFFGSDPVSDAALLEKLPDESVADLQQELFGGEAMQTHAFPDPTVNPLPQLSEPQRQAVPVPQQYAQPAPQSSPYALPPEQRDIWDAAPEPEMDSLDMSSLLNDPPFEDPTLRALEELNQPPQENDSSSFMQSGF